MRKADVRRQHAVRQTSECLLGGVRVNRAQAPEMAGVQRLEKVERFGAAHLAHENAIRAVTQRGAQQVGNGNRREGSLLAERCLRPPRFEADHVRFVEMDLGGFLDDDDAVSGRNVRGECVEQRCLSRPSAARDEDVPLVVDGVAKGVGHGRRKRTDVDQLVRA